MKVLTFIYGVIAYAIFFATFLYAAGFMGNLVVPKDIDTGIDTTVFHAFMVNTLLLAIFAVQHSLMARPVFKEWWTKIIGKAGERSTYVLFSSLALILLFWQWVPIKDVIWEVRNETVSLALTGLFLVGLLTVLLSTFMINHFDLFGLKQVYENLTGKQPREMAFTTNFFYGFVRHPIMLGFLIMLWAVPKMTLGHLFFSIGSTAYIFIAVKYLEEKDLRAMIGEQYVEYQKKVPMLIPFIGWK